MTSSQPLLARVVCPHCWTGFPPDQALWIAEHPELLGDLRLGSGAPQRFLPTRFTVEGAAIDPRGQACHGLACPRCHLPVPRALFELEQSMFSIFGAPGAGKSYFLASMIWRLRQVLPRYFGISFSDTDPAMNQPLQEYESTLFLNPNPEELVTLSMTESRGDLRDMVWFGDQAVACPRPFLFTMAPIKGHPNFRAAGKGSRTLCLYDNAGESFLPQRSPVSPKPESERPVENGSGVLAGREFWRNSTTLTGHLAHSRALFFLFDPTQDIRFRQACAGRSHDPQMAARGDRTSRDPLHRQETIVHEAAHRVRRQAGLGHSAKQARPLIVVVSKFDSWHVLLGEERLPPVWQAGSGTSLHGVQLDLVDEFSRRLRSVLWRLAPEVVSAAESLAAEVVYIPVSATGGSPEVDLASGAFGFRPKHIRPMWAEVPLLYTLARWMPGLVPHCTSTLLEKRGVGS